jgi:hypothetical protein
LESRLEVSFGLRLDEPNQGKKKSILDTLHTKSEEEQAENMIQFWKKQMELVNITSHKQRKVKMGGFNLSASNSCELQEDLVKDEKKILEDLSMGPLDDPEELNPMQLTVRDCLEGENDARKWFVSTMHLYVKFLVNQENLQTSIENKDQKSFLGSLYDVYLSSKKDEELKPENVRERVNLLKNQCYDIEADDVIDIYGKQVLEKGNFR